MRIVVYPRIHVTLISMHSNGLRKNGGVGFSVNNPDCALDIAPSRSFRVNDNRQSPMTLAESDALIKCLTTFSFKYKLNRSIHVTISGNLNTHFGYGSGTALRLACLEGLALSNGRNISRSALTEHSDRGGTSGIGISTYFLGGCVFDLGVINTDNYFEPSDAQTKPKLPLFLDRVDSPNWNVGLCIPKRIPSKTQQQELEFFYKAAPTSPYDSYESLYYSLYGVFASLKENSYQTFCKSINRLQQLEWKRKERNLYGKQLTDLENQLFEHGADCVGMSSLGPLLYFFTNKSIDETISPMMCTDQCDIVSTTFRNEGRFIE